MKKSALLLFVCFIASCATMAPPQISRMAFPENEYQNLAKSGSAVVKGQAFLKTRGGDVKMAAGNDVILNPVTSYSNEWYEKYYIQGKPLVEPDSRVWNYVIRTVADGSGRFIFKNVPAGQYFVTTFVTWEAPTDYGGALQVQGGTVTKRITVNEGDEIEVIVTH
ncbi:hypothetical protein KKG61_04625 [bacterium]|nr:hypothetical protein [bacterium]MBU2461818.1 hypothetical protein [bacterium]